jgi:lipoprotein-anchoring transpeptidase ErfK/SrfK
VSTVIARRDQARRHRRFTVHRGTFCAFGAATILVLTSIVSPAAAATYYWAWPENGDYYAHRSRHKITHREKAAPVEVDKKPFGDVPKGPLQIIISINQQKLHLYSDGAHVADSSVATGVPRLPTPQGVFSVIQKQVFHRSNIYSNAPMPYMQRITWSGVAMHEGEDIGHPASHGCIRMPHDFAARLYRLTKIGVRVIISRPELKPSDIADGHLFVHKEPPPETVANAAPAAIAVPAVPGAPDASAAKTPVSDASAAAATAQQTSPPSSADPKLETPVASSTLTGDPNTADSNSAVPPPPATKLVDTVKSAVAKGSPITVFISRKQGRLYVRQDFQPLFDVPITVEQPDAPFGTHVFTALGYTGDDHTTLRWNVVSLPGEQQRHVRVEESHSRSGKHARNRHVEEDDEAVAPPPQTPAQILARLDIPADVMDAISELIVPGSSLVVSDQGLGGETGEGTDFIVVTR